MVCTPSSIYPAFLIFDTHEDERNIPPLGRIGDPDDILASVLVENGKVCHAQCDARLVSTNILCRFLLAPTSPCQPIVSALPTVSYN